MIDPNGLLMIEPRGPASSEPVEDRYTRLARLALAEAAPGVAYRGHHFCACGAMSDNLAWSVRGMRTNSLLVHYVEHHRDEVPEAELAKLLRFETDRHAEWMKGTTHGSK